MVEKIRDRYYRITGAGVNLQEVSIGDIEYLLEENVLSIAKERNRKGQFEYYFESRENEYFPYFIYYQPANQEEMVIRAYYNDRLELVLYKEDDEETLVNEYNNRYSHLMLNAFNAINTFLNVSEQAHRCP